MFIRTKLSRYGMIVVVVVFSAIRANVVLTVFHEAGTTILTTDKLRKANPITPVSNGTRGSMGQELLRNFFCGVIPTVF
jgi:hypothetical protein